jgi:hypothetical protein
MNADDFTIILNGIIEGLRADLKSERELNIALHNMCAELREEIARLKLCQIK